MFRTARIRCSGRILLGWVTLSSWRGKRKPRPLGTVGVWAVDTSEEATPHRRCQPGTARRWLSTPSMGRRGHRQVRFSTTSHVRFVPRRVLRLSRVRARPALLRPILSPAGPATQVPRLQPSLPAELQRPESSCRTTIPISNAAKASHAQSDGSTSCFHFSFWQSRRRETR